MWRRRWLWWRRRLWWRLITCSYHYHLFRPYTLDCTYNNPYLYVVFAVNHQSLTLTTGAQSQPCTTSLEGADTTHVLSVVSYNRAEYADA